MSSPTAQRTLSSSMDSPSSSRAMRKKEKYVKLNVGGFLYYTAVDTLMKQGDNMLSAMFSGRMEVEKDPEGWVTIDRDGRLFGYILNFFRDGASVPLPPSPTDRLCLLSEAKFYVLDGLMELILREQEMQMSTPRCQIPIITSELEERHLINTSPTPVIRFNYNRQNNMFSYTPNASDNFLKNIELFDKLSLKFNKRILFVKDNNCPRDICTWYFYAAGRCVAEICCTSMFYATEKKQTKVEFPESRIFEYTLDVLMLEDTTRWGIPDTPEYVHRRAAAAAGLSTANGGTGSAGSSFGGIPNSRSLQLAAEAAVAAAAYGGGGAGGAVTHVVSHTAEAANNEHELHYSLHNGPATSPLHAQTAVAAAAGGSAFAHSHAHLHAGPSHERAIPPPYYPLSDASHSRRPQSQPNLVSTLGLPEAQV